MPPRLLPASSSCPSAGSHSSTGRGRFTVAPLYFWAPQVSGNVTASGSSVPVHIEARKGRWGGFGDLIEGTLQLDSVIFEGGVRTFALSPKMEFTGAMVQVAPVDTSQTSTDGFVGLTLRPALTPTLRVIGRADIGGGTADLTQYGPIFGLDLHWGGK